MATLSNYNNDTVVNGTNEVDRLFSSGINVQIYGNDGNDTIENRGYDVTIEAGTGNDSILTDVYSSYGSSHYRSATVDGGDGDDTLVANDNETSLNGGAGNDVISVNSGWDNNTLQGGKGNDVIYGSDSNIFVYSDGDGEDTIYYAKSGDTIQIATNSGYSSQKSGNDLVINVGDGKIIFKNGANLSLNVETIPYTNSDAELRESNIKALNSLIMLGEGTDSQPSYNTNDTEINKLIDDVSKSQMNVVRLMGKIFGEMTKYKLKADGTPELDSNGDKIEDESPSRTIILAGYSALSNVDSILSSAKKIAAGNLNQADLLKEELNISTQTATLVDNIAKLGGDPKAGLITPLGSSVVGLTTNIINLFYGGYNKSTVMGIVNNSSKILSEAIKLFGSNDALKNTRFGNWLATSDAGKKITDFFNGEKNYAANTVSAILGVYSAVDTYVTKDKIYDIEGLPTTAALINKTIDVVTDAIHSFSNAFLIATIGIDADTIFQGVHTIAATIKYSLEVTLALITGSDVNKVKFVTTNKNFMEHIGDVLKSVITGTTSDTYIVNQKDGKSVHVEKSSDNGIVNHGSNCTITSGTGDDAILNQKGTHGNNIDSGSDNDYIGVYGSYNEIYGAHGDDTIFLRSDGSLVAGNNKIYGEPGNDYIIIDNRENPFLSVGTHNTVIGGEGNDTIALIYGNDKDIPAVIRYNVGDGKDTIIGYEENATIQIVNSSYSTTKSGKNAVIKVGKGSITVVNAAGKRLKVQKVTNNALPDGLSYNKKKTLLTVNNKFRGEQIDLSRFASTIKNINAAPLLNVVNNSLNIVGNKFDNSIISGDGNDTITGNEGKDTLRGGNGNDTLYGFGGNDSIDGEKGDDWIFGGVGNDYLKGGSGDDVFIYSAGKDVITDYATGDKISLGAAISKSSISGSDVVFTIGKGSLTVKNGKGKSLAMIDSKGKSFSTIIGGLTTSTLLTVTNSIKSPVTVGSDIQIINASKRTKAVKITGNALDNTISGGSKNDSLYGGNGNDSIVGNAGNDKLYGQAGADTLFGGTGNDTLTGGDGADVFIYSAGKDVITDYATEDKISLGAAISKASISGSDVIFTIGKVSLTVKNGTDKNITVVDKNGNESVKKYSTILTVTDKTKSPVTVDSAIKTIDASSRTSGIKITGNSLANTINGGKGNDSILGGKGNDKLYGGNGNDSLWGGAGNDSLWGDAGNDTFIYAKGDGKDVICDFDDDDMLKITGAFSASYNKSKKEIYFKVGSTKKAITLKDFGSTSTFNINSTTYKISGSKLTRN